MAFADASKPNPLPSLPRIRRECAMPAAAQRQHYLCSGWRDQVDIDRGHQCAPAQGLPFYGATGHARPKAPECTPLLRTFGRTRGATNATEDGPTTPLTCVACP